MIKFGLRTTRNMFFTLILLVGIDVSFVSSQILSFTASQSKKKPDYIQINIPTNPNFVHRIVLAWVNPDFNNSPEKIFSMPQGNIDGAIKEATEALNATGVDTVRMSTKFDNGEFDVTLHNTDWGTKAVYAVCLVLDKTTKKRIGSTATYYNLAGWTDKSTGKILIFVPTDTMGANYIPKSCNLILWLIAESGEKIGKTQISISR